LHALSDELRLDGSVAFLGAPEHEAEIFSVVKASRLFVNPSTKEGGGSITLLEANACGIPVIALQHPLGIDAALIHDGVNGWWVDDPGAGALAAKILEALGDEERLDRASAGAKAFAKRFDWSQIASQYEEVYNKVVTGR
jgi:glycosyltransferase involved in cell wall biosynthesis